MKILDYSPSERPREKLLDKGPRFLSDAELIAILLRTGTMGANAVDTARKLLARVEYKLSALEAVGVRRMCDVSGIGISKAITLAAAMELSRRISFEKAGRPRCIVNTSDDAYLMLRPMYENEDKEECRCLFLKRSRRVISSLKVSEGGATLTEIDIKKIVRNALEAGASYVILSHNHPSGDPRPSTADIRLTKQLEAALKTFELLLMDHIILSEEGYYSFADGK